MLVLLKLWPTMRHVISARWWERVWRGEKGDDWLGSLLVEDEKERRAGMDQIRMFESGDPERRKLDVGSTTRHVVACRWDGGVETCRPVHSYLVGSAIPFTKIWNMPTSHNIILPPSVPNANIPAPFGLPTNARLHIFSGNGTNVS